MTQYDQELNQSIEHVIESSDVVETEIQPLSISEEQNDHQKTSNWNEVEAKNSSISGGDMMYLILGTVAMVGIWSFPYTYPSFFEEYDPRTGDLLYNTEMNLSTKI